MFPNRARVVALYEVFLFFFLRSTRLGGNKINNLAFKNSYKNVRNVIWPGRFV